MGKGDGSKNLSQAVAVILVGGLGTRLRPVVADRPKTMAQIHGRPFLSYLLDQMVAWGIRKVVLCTGYLGEQIRAHFGDSYDTLHLAYSQEPAPLDTAGALRLALPLLASPSVLVMNGDSFCDIDPGTFYAWHCMRNSEATLLLTSVPDTSRYGCVQIGNDGRVLHFEEKNKRHGWGWINAGTYLIGRSLIGSIPANVRLSLERDVFPTWIGKGFYGYCAAGRFLDIGTPESYSAAEEFFGSIQRSDV
jgi:NDP-sugar pyrophosphorylase family protein